MGTHLEYDISLISSLIMVCMNTVLSNGSLVDKFLLAGVVSNNSYGIVFVPFLLHFYFIRISKFRVFYYSSVFIAV